VIDPFVLDILVDPIDHGPLYYAPGAGLLVNPRRRVAYEVRDGIAVLLPDEARPLDEAEAAGHLEDPDGRWTGVGA
jgi:uncharacterized protein